MVPIFTVVFAYVFRRRQNTRPEIVGGEISLPKAFWLAFAIGAWFFFPFVLIINTSVPSPIRTLLCLHLLSWWIRGPLELVMIYRWFNWSPVYGIGHDLVHLVLLVTGMIWCSGVIGWETITQNSLALSGIGFVLLLIISTAIEAIFAGMFLIARGGEKNHKIYFASDSEEYRTINRLTFACDWFCYSLWGACILVATH